MVRFSGVWYPEASKYRVIVRKRFVVCWLGRREPGIESPPISPVLLVSPREMLA
jgi:hypothetical protein